MTRTRLLNRRASINFSFEVNGLVTRVRIRNLPTVGSLKSF